jgi:Putative zinc-finger
MIPPSGGCAEIRAALPELALGIADGEERAAALEHVVTCASCRRELDELSAIADDLITLAPQQEPPGGFEARVLDQFKLRQVPRSPTRLGTRRFAFAGALLAAVAATAVVMTASYSSDRRLASQYRAALQGADGQYFQSAGLRTPSGNSAGIVFAYQGSPSWLFYVMSGRHASGSYSERIVTRSGKTITLPPFRLVAASWGIATPVPLRDIASVTLVREPSGPELEADLPLIEP